MVSAFWTAQALPPWPNIASGNERSMRLRPGVSDADRMVQHLAANLNHKNKQPRPVTKRDVDKRMKNQPFSSKFVCRNEKSNQIVTGNIFNVTNIVYGAYEPY